MGGMSYQTIGTIVILIAAAITFFILFKNKRKSSRRSNVAATADSSRGVDTSWDQPEITQKDFKDNATAEDKKADEGHAPVKAYVYDDITGRCGPEDISWSEVKTIVSKYKTMGRPRDKNRTGKFLFYLDRFKNEQGKTELKPVEFPYSVENTAEILYMATEQPEIPDIWNFTKVKGMMEKYGPIIMFAAFGIFLLWSNAQK
jgi:hypothetical protein